VNKKPKSKPFDATNAKEICRIAGLVPFGFELKNVSDVFERILTDPTQTLLDQDDVIKPYLKAALGGPLDPNEYLEFHELLLLLRSAAAVSALHECCDGLGDAFIENFWFRPLDENSVHRLLLENARFEISFEKFKSLGEAFPNWLSVATGYAEILDACQRYTTVRSWCERLDSLALIGGTFLRHNASGLAPLLMKEDLFPAGKLTIRDGIISVETDKFTEAFVGAPIERIRRCNACKRVYWADRIDMKGCSSGCAKIIRMRKWRSKPENRQKEQHRDYERYKKSLKENK